ncbi:tetratricopeptide repeat protein [Nostoc parmelioides]|uniref:Tetratricopeptide repeat protein n=1 Tax=Nostoc parmelioides FACHB-3921 TaxID=2692909 RepID=A0ABR8BJS0_9NOSO|nr:tetratricopeptide repeat protein [Nostoc parmelioides]MBD2253954.1 tetratricopeptide repeat protein [Nostoc parmelioides FACHB-3921]
MPDYSGKVANKIGAYAAPGGQVNIDTLIIKGQKQLTPTKYIPRGSVHFVGREQELTLLHEDLQRGNYVAISGMGGIGKTELATQYARRYQANYDGVAWFNDRANNLAAGILEYFIGLGLEISQELGGKLLTLKEQIAWCWLQYAESSLPILIIFDDVTDLANLREVIPTDNRFRVLVTTRLRNLEPNFIQDIPLDVLSPEKEPDKALELLKRLLGNTDRRVDNQPVFAREICKSLEYLPLGIELVGAYLRQDPDLFLDVMLEQLQERKLTEAALQNRETLTSTQLGVKAAFALTWSELDPIAQQLGRFLSLFSPQSILWDLVVWVATDGGEEENQEAATQLTWSAEELNEAKKELYRRNLLQLVEDSQGYYQIYTLVRWFLQEQLTDAGEMKAVLETTFASAMIAVAQSLPQSPTSEDIESIQDVVPHIEDLGHRLIDDVNQAGEEPINSPASVPNDEVAWVFVGVARFYEGQGLYQLAEVWYEGCVNVCQTIFLGDHPHVASSLNNLAALYDNQGRYGEAEPLYIDALAMTKRLFVGDHPDVATSLNNLAGLYKSQGRYGEAEPLYIDALTMRKRLFVGDHPGVATSLNNLAALYDNQGRYGEAEPLYIDALVMTKRLFVGDHPDVATSLNNLALLYNSQGRYGEAEPLYIDALAMRKRLFVGDHPNVANSLNNLALLYNSQGRYGEAEPLYIDALAMRKCLFVGDHPHVATGLNNLAALYDNQGRYGEAEPLYIDALAMTKRLFVGDHPDVANSLNNLALLYKSQGRYGEAEPLYLEALQMCQRVLGVNHPTTVTVQENLAILQRQLTPVATWQRRLSRVLQLLLRIFFLPFYWLRRSLNRH